MDGTDKSNGSDGAVIAWCRDDGWVETGAGHIFFPLR
ncbi:MAG: hypothetical protein JWM99_5145 [Verrucomicrobiales bacterium]|nr:hypothetical protein [Verrucomicrobiales bacterium]